MGKDICRKDKMYGLAIKIWSSDFDKHSGNFNITDSVVYLCHDIVHKDIIYLSTVINHIVGDDSLENIFKKHIPIIKGEPSSGEESLDSLVKVEIEQQNESPDEDSIEGKSEKLIYPRCGKCDKESSGNN